MVLNAQQLEEARQKIAKPGHENDWLWSASTWLETLDAQVAELQKDKERALLIIESIKFGVDAALATEGQAWESHLRGWSEHIDAAIAALGKEEALRQIPKEAI